MNLKKWWRRVWSGNGNQTIETRSVRSKSVRLQLEVLEDRLAPALVAHYTFTNPGNLGLDSSGNGNNLVNAGNPVYSSQGINGGALSMNGTANYLAQQAGSFPTGVPIGGNPYTIAAWINPTGPVNALGIVGWGNYGTTNQVNAFRVANEFPGGNGLKNYWWGNDFYGTAASSLFNAWHFVTAVYDPTLPNNQRSIYIDGNLAGQNTASGLNAQAVNFAIGDTNFGEYFNGLLSDVQIYNNALSAAQISALAAPPATLSATLSGGNLTVADSSGQDNHLTVSRSGANVVITDSTQQFASAPPPGTLSNNNQTLSIPLTSVTGSLTIDGNGGNDSVLVDYTGGDPIPSGGLSYDGGTGSNSLAVKGAFQTATETFTTTGPGHSGSVQLDDGVDPVGTIGYVNLAPVDMTGSTVTNLVFNLPGGGTTAQLEDNGTTGDQISQIRNLAGSGFETTPFSSNGLTSLTVNGGGGGTDTLNVASMPDFGKALVINNTVQVVNLNADNTFTSLNDQGGATTVNAASVTLSTAAANGNLTIASALNDANATPTNALALTAGTGTVSLPAVGASQPLASLTSTTTTTGSTTLGGNVTANTITLSGNVALGTAVQLTHSGAASLSASGGTLSLGASVLTDDGTTATTTGSISDTIASGTAGNGVTVNGNATSVLTLSGTNTYTGPTTVTLGVLQLGSATALGSTAGGTSVASGAVLDLNGQAVGAEPVALNGTGNGNGALTNSSATAASLAGTVTSAGSYSVGGTGNITLSGSVQNSLAKVNGNTLTLSGTTDNAGLGLTASGGTVILAKTSSGSVHAVGGGGLTINNTATVQLAGSGGDQIYNGGGTGVTINAGGTLDMNANSETIMGLSGAGTVDNVSAGGTPVLTIGASNQTATFSGVIQNTTGSLALTKTGTGAETLSGTSTFTGGTTISQGTLVHASNNATGAVTAPITIGDANTGANATKLTFTAGLINSNNSTTYKPITVTNVGGTTTFEFDEGGAFANINIATSKAITLTTANGGSQFGMLGTISGSGAGAGNTTVTFSNTGGGSFFYTAGYSGSGVVQNSFAGNLLLAGNVILQNLSYINAAFINGDIPDTASVTVNSGVTWTQGWGGESIDALNGAGNINIGSGGGGAVTLTVGASGGTGTFSGAISGSGGALTKTGAGTETLSGSNSYTGATQVNGGTFNLTGSITSNTTVGSGGTLTGSGNGTTTGKITGTLTVNSGSTVAPTAGVGTPLTVTGNATLSSGSNFNVTITDASTGNYSQLGVGGTPTVSGANLSVNGTGAGLSSASQQTFRIVKNTGAAAVVGTFSGLPEGTPITVTGSAVKPTITYNGALANNIDLNTQPVVNGTPGNDNFIFRKSLTAGMNEYSTDGGTSFTQIANTLGVTFNGDGGADTLTYDFGFNGDPGVSVTFNGGGNAGDTLIVTDTGNTRTAIYRVDSVTTPQHAGSVVVGTDVIAFTGLAPTDITGMANVNIDNTTFVNANQNITIANGTNGSGNPSINVSGTTGGVGFETLRLRNDTSVSINTSTPSGNDTVTINSADGTALQANVTNLTINTGTGTDSVSINGAVTLPGNLQISTQTMNITAGTTAAGNINLTASGAITESSGILSTAGTLTTSSATGTTLNGANTVSTFTASNSTSGNISLTNTATTLTVTGISELGGTVSVSNTGAISITGAVTSGNGSTSGGAITLTATTGLTVTGTGSVSSASGSGGSLSVSGKVTLSGPVTVGAGTVTLNGGGGTSADIVINSAQSIAGPVSLTASRDIIIQRSLTNTTGAISLVAGTGAAGVGAGGVWVDDTGPNFGFVGSAGALTITGKDVFATSGSNTDAVLLNASISAGGTMTLDNTTTGGAAPAGAGIVLQGAATTSAGDILANQPVTAVGNPSTSFTNTGPGNITFASTVNGTSPLALNVTANGAVLFTGVVGGSSPPGSLTVSGSTISLPNVTTTGTQSYTGATTLHGNLTSSSGAITVTGAATLAASSTIDTTQSGTGANIHFTSTIDDSTANTDTLNLKAGTGNVTVGGSVGGSRPLASLTITSAGNVNAGAITAGAITQMAGTGTSTFTGLLHATAAGGLNLAGTNFSITGGITVDNGAAAITDSGTVTVSGPAVTLNAQTFTVTNTGAGTISSQITGTGSGTVFTKTGGGTLTVSNPANNYTGNTLISGGSFKLGNSEVIPNTSSVTDNATLDLAGFSETIDGLNGSGMVTDSVGSTTSLLTIGFNNAVAPSFSGVIQDGSGQIQLTKIGTGDQTLSGINTYTGPTMINGGTLTVNGVINNNAVATGGTVQLNTAGVILNGTGVIKGQVAVAASNHGSPSQVQNVTITVPGGGTGINVLGGVTFVQIGTLSGVTVNGGDATSTGIQVTGSALIENSSIFAQNVDVRVSGGVAALQSDTLTPGSGNFVSGLLVSGGGIVDAGQLSASATPLPNGPAGNVGYYGDITGLFSPSGVPLSTSNHSSGGNSFGTAGAPFALDTLATATPNPGPNIAQAIRDENTGTAPFGPLANGVEQPLGGPFSYGAAGPQLGRMDVTAQANSWNGNATLPIFQIEQLIFHDIDDNRVGFVTYGNTTAPAPTITTTPLYSASTITTLSPTQAGQGTLVNGSSQGTEQMSAIRALQVTFSSYVFLDPNLLSATTNYGIQLLQLNSPYGPAGFGGGAIPQLIRVVVFSTKYDRTTGAYTVVFTWSGAGTEYGSLQDGNYSLNFNASAIQGGGPGGPALTGTYANPSTYTAVFHRLFGDFNNDFQTDDTDLAAFQLALRSRVGMANYRAYFDFDNNGTVDTGDYNMFLRRYKTKLNADGTTTIIP